MTIEDQILSNLSTKPYPFQVQGVRFLERTAGKAILGHEMGLGKTYMTIAWLKLHPESLPAVVICPATLKLNWQKELWQHAKLKSELVEGTKPYDLNGNIWIINYDILKNWVNWFIERGHPMSMVMDEAHAIKNAKAFRTRAAKLLSTRTQHVIAMSGTPITNRPIEFFPVLNMIAPKDFNSLWDYGFLYCAPKRGWRGRGWDFNGASNLDKLHERVKPYLIRRTKAEVMTDLPPKTRSVIPIEIENRREYEKAKNTFLQWLGEKKGIEAVRRAKGSEGLVRLGQLQQLAAMGKLRMITDWIKDFMEETTEKLVVFSVHHAITEALVQEFPEALRLDGTIPQDIRNKAVDQFQKVPKKRLLLCGLDVGGVGLTLTAASKVAFTELGWTPAAHDQAEDRVLRIGQTAEHVDCYYFIAQDTVEEAIWRVLDNKRKVVGQVLDGRDTSQDIFTEILTLLTSKSRQPEQLSLPWRQDDEKKKDEYHEQPQLPKQAG